MGLLTGCICGGSGGVGVVVGVGVVGGGGVVVDGGVGDGGVGDGGVGDGHHADYADAYRVEGEGASMFSLVRDRHLKGRNFWPGDVRGIEPGPAVRTGAPR